MAHIQECYSLLEKLLEAQKYFKGAKFEALNKSKGIKRIIHQYKSDPVALDVIL